ncbi:DUF4123 domain-containing protein [Massilia litorea]|jgi:hypothetical protein|uniref:DUF4123 domain-containing protein n=1 Tax=Massilia litorea TaxID=2769491 RepID=A0A7L9U9C4_9BURK|nr:DUF4123 domain-containing protein [Massilia litorea]QOL51634.1 DUF4123 domain-containing protein [Massilia litorea]
MLIDPFNEKFLDELDMRAAEMAAPNKLYLLIDGAFVPGLHKTLASEVKSLLFAYLPGFNDETADASPFLTPYVTQDKPMRRLLRRCSGWPMLSLIETPESLVELSARLSAWCVVEADGQRFNFRFPDTRRLPTIYQTLDATQRAKFAGPARRWSYVGREGAWAEFDVTAANAEPADNPALSERQFAALVDDSRADELLALFSDWGYELGKRPSVSHACVAAALHVAVSVKLPEDDVLPWCTWFWKHAKSHHDSAATVAFQTWQTLLY